MTFALRGFFSGYKSTRVVIRNAIRQSNHSSIFSDAEARSSGMSALVSKSDHISALIGT